MVLSKGKDTAMAELILTEEEQAAAQWKDLDDDALGKLCKLTLSGLDDQDKEREAIHGYSAALLMVILAARMNATTYKQTINGVTCDGKSLGNWEITCKKIEPKTKREKHHE